jgi:hypothetical protein
MKRRLSIPINTPCRDPDEEELAHIKRKIDKVLYDNMEYREKLKNTHNKQKISLKDLSDRIILINNLKSQEIENKTKQVHDTQNAKDS